MTKIKIIEKCFYISTKADSHSSIDNDSDFFCDRMVTMSRIMQMILDQPLE